MNGEKIFRVSVRNEKVISHTERVVSMCMDFADKLDISHYDRNILINAAWIHDIAKSISGEAHNMPENVKSAVSKAGYNIDSDIAVLDVICAHKGDFSPEAGLALVSSILRICDKLDKFNKNSSDAMSKSELAVSLAKKKLSDKEYDKLRAVYDEYIDKFLLGK